MKTFPLTILLLSLCFAQTVKASGTDTTVYISRSEESYEFSYSKKNNKVSIKEDLRTNYLTTKDRTSVTISEFYDTQTSIDHVSAYKGKFLYTDMEPKYDYYSVENVFYSDAHVCHFELPVESKKGGSEVRFDKTISDPRYFTAIYFSDSYSITEKTVTILIPRWMKVELKEMNFGSADIKKTTEYNARQDADIITYTIHNMAASKEEYSSPGPTYTEPHLMVLSKYADVEGNKLTYFNTLADQYAWYRELTKDPGNDMTVIKAKAEEITKNIPGDIEKIKAIFYWMHDNIRYIAFEDGLAGFKPAKADEVLRKKYGDCKGMAHLTKELLCSVGYDARLCWIGTNHIAYDYSTPSLAVDNHMICALFFKGQTYFLDATENYIGFNEYAERIQGRQVLIEDGDKYIYTNVPKTTYLQNEDMEKSTLSIKGTDLTGKITREWKGEEKENIFAHLNNTKKQHSLDAFKNYLGNDNNEIAITEFKTSGLDNYDQPLTVSYQFDFNKGVSAFGDELYIDIDQKKELNNFTMDLKKRTKDFCFSYKLNSQCETTLVLPEGYQLTSFPPNVDIKNNDYEFHTSITQAPGKMIYSKKIFIKNTFLKKKDFEQWNKDIEKLTTFYNEQIVLSKK